MGRKLCAFSQRHRLPFFIFMAALAVIFFLILVNIFSIQTVMKFWEFRLQGAIESSDGKNSYLQMPFYGQLLDYNIKSSQEMKTFSKKDQKKVILIWCPLFKGWDFLQVGEDSFKKSGCSEHRCEITSDRNRLSESDAILFHIRTISLSDIPKDRQQNQKWIFFSLEAPPYSYFQGFNFMFGMFNWTMTYRDDSDVIIRYGRILPKTTETVFNTTDLYAEWQMKTKMATWMVSHCSTDSNREEYIRKLKAYMEIDTYGLCGMAACTFNKTSKCLENFSKKYFFFLAFENAICDGYITEKFFRTLQFNLIPVVFGGGNYDDIAPPKSYINAMNFPSPKELSSHLHQIASNFTLFSEYFKWRSRSYVDDNPNHCKLCEKLHSESFHQQSAYYDINDWWIQKSHCRKWT